MIFPAIYVKFVIGKDCFVFVSKIFPILLTDSVGVSVFMLTLSELRLAVLEKYITPFESLIAHLGCVDKASFMLLLSSCVTSKIVVGIGVKILRIL